jgi:hypothetical protein
MKCFVFSLFSLVLCFSGLAQNNNPTSVARNAQSVYLVDANNPSKKIRIDPRGTLSFVKYDETVQNNAGDSVSVENLSIYTGNIDSINANTVYVEATEETNTVYENSMIMSRNSGQYYETSKRLSLNINEMDGLYYSSRRRDVGRNIMFSVMGVSLFTAFVIAPLASIEYKKASSNDASGFDRPMYFAIAGAGLLSAAISLPIIYLLRPKYYSFKGDNYAPTTKRWMLSSQQF